MKPSSIVPPVKRYRPRSGITTSTATTPRPAHVRKRPPIAPPQTARCRRGRRRSGRRSQGEQASGARLLAWRPRGPRGRRRGARPLVRPPPAGHGDRGHRRRRRCRCSIALVDLAGSRLVSGPRPGDDRVPCPRRVRRAHAADRPARADRRVPEPGQPPRAAELLPPRPAVPAARVDVVGAGGGDGGDPRGGDRHGAVDRSRRAGWRGVLGVAALLAVAIRGYGQLLLTQPWNPYLPLLAWLVVLLATWSVLCGDSLMLVPLVVAGSLCAQTHVPYLVPVRRADDRVARRRHLAAPALALGGGAPAGSTATSSSPRRSASCCGCRRSSTS